jgi:hypothetical protein
VLLLACARHPADVSTIPPVRWGDLHAHSGLSDDACEQPTDDCTADPEGPGASFFANAAGAGLDFVALTDHAEFTTWTDLATGASADIAARSRELADAARGVLPILGFEWSYECDETFSGGHRTVLFEDLYVVPEDRIPACARAESKLAWGRETYAPSDLEPALDPAALAARLAGRRTLAYFHHPAYDPPEAVDWALGDDGVDDVLVEIASEHGSSEFSEPDSLSNAAFYQPQGSIQAALATGRRLGFVGGTDNHQSHPGSLDDGPGYLGFTDESGNLIRHHAEGTVTGAYVQDLNRPALFDALEARNTLVATWIPDGLAIWAEDEGGDTWLPGSVVPPGSYTVLVSGQDDLDLALVGVDAVVSSGDTFTLEQGEFVYARLSDGANRTVWTSPFFAEGDQAARRPGIWWEKEAPCAGSGCSVRGRAWSSVAAW